MVRQLRSPVHQRAVELERAAERVGDGGAQVTSPASSYLVYPTAFIGLLVFFTSVERAAPLSATATTIRVTSANAG